MDSNATSKKQTEMLLKVDTYTRTVHPIQSILEYKITAAQRVCFTTNSAKMNYFNTFIHIDVEEIINYFTLHTGVILR